MKNKRIKAITFMALTLGVSSIANAQLYRERLSDQAGISLRANNDSSSNAEYFRFYTGRSNETNGTNYIAELSHNRLTLNGRFSSDGLNVVDPVGSHFILQSERGLTIRSDFDNNNSSSETIRFIRGNNIVAEVFNDGMNMTRLIARNSTLPIRVGNTDVMDLSTSRIAFRRNIILNTSGNNRIGIGTANPTKELHINGEVRIDNGRLLSNGDMIFRPGLTGNDRIEFRNSSNEEMAYIQDGNIDLLIRGANGGGEIRSNGALKFKPEADRNGESDSVSFFDSNNNERTIIQDGIITTDEVRLKLSSFADYVFAKDYKLMPLKEVATYIKKHKHLPNVPSEAEIVANGMDLSKINLILVEKVEELTLHTINQEEQMQLQEQKIALLLKRLETLEAAINE